MTPDRIKYLMERYKLNNLSKEEFKELLGYLNYTDMSPELSNYYQQSWESSSKHYSGVNSNEILTKIHEQIEIKPNSTGNTPWNHALYVFMRYAAIFIVAFGLSWFIKSWYEENLIQEKNKPDINNSIITVAHGSKSKIHLPDGSLVKLNSGSKLIYPALFNGNERWVYLEGEGFFEIDANPEKPFFVKTSDIDIRVTGTRFNVKSFPESKTIETILLEGSLDILKNMHDKYKIATLKPQQKAVFRKKSSQISLSGEMNEIKENHAHDQQIRNIKPLVISKINDAEIETAWKDNKLIFNNKSFSELIVDLERWYGVNIELKNKKLTSERFTGKFDTESIEQVMDALKLTTNFKYEINKNHIEIY